jgi:hypothetical protein
MEKPLLHLANHAFLRVKAADKIADIPKCSEVDRYIFLVHFQWHVDSRCAAARAFE